MSKIVVALTGIVLTVIVIAWIPLAVAAVLLVKVARFFGFRI